MKEQVETAEFSSLFSHAALGVPARIQVEDRSLPPIAADHPDRYHRAPLGPRQYLQRQSGVRPRGEDLRAAQVEANARITPTHKR